MKYKPIFRILALAIILSLLVVAIPAIPTYAVTGDKYITLSPDDGEIDEEIDIDGYDFELDEDVDIYFTSEDVDEGDDIDNVDAYELVQSDTTDEDGYFATYFDVPDELTDGDDEEVVRSGDYYVFVTYEGDDEIVAVADFTVIGYAVTGDESISIDPDKGEIGDDIDIEGWDFELDEGIDIYFTSEDVDEGDDLDDLDVYERVESDDTDDEGEFSTSFKVPSVLDDGDDKEDVTGGTYYVFVTYEDDEEIIDVEEFTVIGNKIGPTLRLPPGLRKKGLFAHFEGRWLPPGWFKGKKTGWDKDR